MKQLKSFTFLIFSIFISNFKTIQTTAYRPQSIDLIMHLNDSSNSSNLNSNITKQYNSNIKPQQNSNHLTRCPKFHEILQSKLDLPFTPINSINFNDSNDSNHSQNDTSSKEAQKESKNKICKYKTTNFWENHKDKFRDYNVNQFATVLTESWHSKEHKNYPSFEEFVLNQWPLYKFPNFRYYTNKFPGRDEYILSLYNKFIKEPISPETEAFLKSIPRLDGKFKDIIKTWGQEIIDKQNKEAAQKAYEKKTKEEAELKTYLDTLEQKRIAWVTKEQAKIALNEQAKKEFEDQQALIAQEELTQEPQSKFGKIKNSSKNFIQRIFAKEELSPQNQKLNLLTEEFSQVQNDQSSNKYQKELASLGLELTEDAKYSLEENTFESITEYQKTEARALSVYETLKDPNGQEVKTCIYEVKQCAVNHLNDLEVNPEGFYHCSGDVAQQHLHKEIVDITNETADILDAHQNYFQINSISNVIYLAADQASICNQNKKIQSGFAIADFCASMLELEKQFIHVIAHDIDLGLQALHIIGEGVCQGVSKGIYDSAKYSINTFRNPIETTKDYGKAIESACSLIKKCAIHWVKLEFLKEADPEEFIKQSDRDFAKIFNFTKSIINHIKENPSDSLTESVAFVTQFFIPLPTAQSVTLKKFKKITQILQEEEKLVQDISDPNVTKLAAPITTIAKEAQEITKIAAKEGLKNTESALKTLQKNLFLVENENPNLLLKALTKFEDKFPTKNVNWKHSFCGEIQNEELKGFHHFRNYPERIEKITKKPDKHGIYEAIYSYKGKTKKSTSFPDEWNRVKVIEKVKEAYQNPTKSIKKNGFIGTTKEGINIQFWFLEKPNKPEEFIINSFYPYVSE